jgi:CHAT domain-containing protein
VQVAMLKGQIRIEKGKLQLPGELGEISLPPGLVGKPDLSHPYYWAGFTMIGSPW